MSLDRTARRFFHVLLVAAAIAALLVIRPLAASLFIAAVLAGVLWPLHGHLTRTVRYRGISAAILVAVVIVLIVGPLVLFSVFLVKEGTEGVKFVSDTIRSDGVAGLVAKLPEPIGRLVGKMLLGLPSPPGGGMDAAVQEQLSSQGGRAAAVLGAAVAATGSLVFQAAMMLVAFYFLLLEGDELVAWLDRASPLRPGQTRELLAEFKRVSFAVVTATAITAGVQTSVAVVGYLVVRVPHPVFFAGVTFFLAFIPAIGAASVSIAAALLLVVQGHPYAAVFLAAWGLLVVGLVDNVVKPYLIRAGMELRGAVVFFALIGGLGAFGPVGLLLGPLIVAAFLALVRMYERDFKPGVTPGRPPDHGR